MLLSMKEASHGNLKGRKYSNDKGKFYLQEVGNEKIRQLSFIVHGIQLRMQYIHSGFICQTSRRLCLRSRST